MMVILWVVQTSAEFLVDRSIHMPFTATDLSYVPLHLTSERSPFYLPPGFVLDPAMAVEARHERESYLPPRE